MWVDMVMMLNIQQINENKTQINFNYYEFILKQYRLLLKIYIYIKFKKIILFSHI
jgi:hypothetical protein